jgi:hypothetical protein
MPSAMRMARWTRASRTRASKSADSVDVRATVFGVMVFIL